MSLPEVKHVKYEFFVPELGKNVKYRAFLVGEHKALLTAIEFGDAAALSNVILDTVSACTFNEIDMSSIGTHIVDLIYLKIFIKSSGAKVQAQFNCANTIRKLYETETAGQQMEEIPCGGSFPMMLDLEQGGLVYPEGFKEKTIVKISEDAGIVLRVPSYEFIRSINLKDGLLDLTDKFIFSCIAKIFDGDTVSVPGIDFNEQQLIDWVNKLDGSVLTDLAKFFEELPYLGMDVPVTCPDCGEKAVIKLRGLDDFFV